MDKPKLPPRMQVVQGGLIRVDPRLDPRGNLDEDQICLRCGYMLRGVPFRGPCPECGMLVRHSFMGDVLEYSDPEYVAALHRGAIWVQVGAAIGLARWVAMIVGDIPVLSTTTTAPAAGGVFTINTNATVLEAVVSAIGFAGTAIGAWGLWLLARPDPAHMTANQGGRARLVLRIALLANVVGAALWAARDFAPGLFQAAVVSVIVGTIWIAGWTVEFFAAMKYVQWLAARIPDAKLRDDARQLSWLGPSLSVALFCIVYIGPMIAIVMYYLLFNRLRKALRSLREDQGTLGATVFVDSSRPIG